MSADAAERHAAREPHVELILIAGIGRSRLDELHHFRRRRAGGKIALECQPRGILSARVFESLMFSKGILNVC